MAATTRADWAEQRLRTAILTGELGPGERIRIEQLAADWQLSPTPLREAIRSLAQNGLVELSPQRGATVAGLSPEEIADIYELRLLLEPRALRGSLRRRSWSWRADVEAAWDDLRGAWGDAPPRSARDRARPHPLPRGALERVRQRGAAAADPAARLAEHAHPAARDRARGHRGSHARGARRALRGLHRRIAGRRDARGDRAHRPHDRGDRGDPACCATSASGSRRTAAATRSSPT